MTLQEKKELFNKLGFSEEAQLIVNEIFDNAIEKGSMDKDSEEKLLALIDIESEATKIEIDAMKEVSSIIDDFTEKVYQSIDDANSELESIDSDLLKNIE
jgi:hypothetical protein